MFSEVYIDEKNNKIVGSDIKSYFNESTFKTDKRNEPRFYANSATITKENTVFEKGVFTSCKKREGKKCPPWAIRAKKIEHNSAKKINKQKKKKKNKQQNSLLKLHRDKKKINKTK